MQPNKKTVLLWLDTETTGLDTRHDHLLELGMRFTDTGLRPLDGGFSSPVRWLGHPDQFIREMHTPNGLLEACATAPMQPEVIKAAKAYLKPHLHDRILPAGSTVRFDRDLLDRIDPDLLAGCDHRSLDVSAINEAAKAWWPEVAAKAPDGRTNHRVDHCLDDTIGWARYYMQALK